MSNFTLWFLGIVATLGVIVGQLVFPFAFDFVATLSVYGLGVFVGRAAK